MRRASPTTVLRKKRWRLPPSGLECQVVWPHSERIRQIDDAWPKLRLKTDLSAQWRWNDICKRAKEFFVVESGNKENLGIWSSNNPTCEVEGQKFYVLSKLEVSPNHRTAGVGHLLVTMCALRATELGCSGVLLAAGSELEHFYGAIGGVKRVVKNWIAPRELDSWVFEGNGFHQLKEDNDEFLLEEGQ
ncbi:GNAT family N-acetyltransferase [Myxococcus sp. AB025B]|uniref:GNAT family N-acetyltransferase n=1 Tax=Myxococcus sp. AB025B TaxID=2562794 RepID=UPI001142BF53